MNKNWLRIGAALLCWAATAYLAIDMKALVAREELWGWRPLWLLVSAWGGLLLLVGQYITRLPQRQQLAVASCLSGLLLSVGFVPMPVVPALLVGFVPLLWAEQQVSAARPERTSKWTVFKLAYNTFLIWNILCTFWVLNTGLVAGLIAAVLNSLFMSLAFVFYHVFKHYHDRKLAGLIFGSVWIAFEWGHLRWDLSWAWLNLGNGFAHIPWAIQWYEYVGALGGSIWILWVNAAIATRWNELWERVSAENRRPTIAEAAKLFLWQPLMLVLIPVVVSLVMFWTYSEDKSRSVEVVSVQPNFEPHYQKFALVGESMMEHFLHLSATQLTPNTDYLLFPETSFGIYRIGSPLPPSSFVHPLKDFVRQYPKLKLITGVSSGQEYPQDKAPKTAYRRDCKQLSSGELTDCKYREYHNAAIQISNETDSIPVYKKSKLVPGAETLPFIGDVDFLKGLVLSLGGMDGFGLGTQPQRDAFRSTSGVVAPVICYESAFGQYVTDYVKRGAQALFVVTNDGWWDNTPGHIQHLHYSVLRAIETRRPVVRSANTGISAFINSRGDIYQRTHYNEAIAIRNTIHPQDKITFYVRYGDLFARIGGFLFFMWWLSSIVKWLQGSKQAKSRPGQG